MSNNDTAVQIRGFTGLNSKDNPGAIEDTELTELVNFNVGLSGELIKRTGLEIFHNGVTLGLNSVKMLGHFYTDTISQIIIKSGSKVYYTTDGSTMTEIGTYADAEWGVQYAGEFYIIRSGNVIVKWTGSVASDIVGSPSGSFAIIYKERMYVLNTMAAGTLNSRLYFSAAGDVSATGWPGTNFFDIQPGDGDFLVSLVILQDLLIIFKGKGTWALYVQGSVTDWVVRSLNSELGCVSKYAMEVLDGYLFISSVKGIYRTDGTIFTEISQSIADVFDNRIINSTTVNVDSLSVWGEHIICLVSPNSGSQSYYTYTYKIGAWSKWSFSGSLAPQTFLKVRSNTPGAGLYCGDSQSTGRVYRYGGVQYSDGGASYTASVATKEFDMNLPMNLKRGKWFGVDIIGAGTLSWENEADYTAVSNGSFTSTAIRSLAKVEGPGFFRIWKLTLSTSDIASLTVLGITLMMSAHRGVIKANT